MSKTIQIDFSDGRTEEHVFPENLYELDWRNYQAIERKIKMNAELDRNGDVTGFNVKEENFGDFIVDLQGTMAEKVLAENNIELNEVKTSTVKRIIEEYGNDMQEMGLKLKKKRPESDN